MNWLQNREVMIRVFWHDGAKKKFSYFIKNFAPMKFVNWRYWCLWILCCCCSLTPRPIQESRSWSVDEFSEVTHAGEDPLHTTKIMFTHLFPRETLQDLEMNIFQCFPRNHARIQYILFPVDNFIVELMKHIVLICLGSGQRLFVGNRASGRFNVSPRRVGSKKSDPWTTLHDEASAPGARQSVGLVFILIIYHNNYYYLEIRTMWHIGTSQKLTFDWNNNHLIKLINVVITIASGIYSLSFSNKCR